MRGLTRSNIAHNLEISPHRYDVGYPSQTVQYVFSSELYRQKFIEQYESHRSKINDSLSNRFGFDVDCTSLADLKLYTTIEKRGFLVLLDGEQVKYLEDITLSGERMTKENYNE